MDLAPPAQRLRLAMIGIGGISRHQAHIYKERGDLVEIVGACDVVEERARDYVTQYGTGRPYGDVAAMLRELEPDAVYISTPNYLHAELSIQALESGAHVLCEKPIATNLVDAERMKETAQRVGRILYIGFNHRLEPGFHHAKELLDSGKFGQLLTARIIAGHSAYQQLSRSWFGQRRLSGGGTLVDNGVHMIDLLRWYGYEITEVSAQIGRLRATDGDVEDNALALLRLHHGGMASLQCSWTWPPNYRAIFQIICERGTIDLTNEEAIVYHEDDPTIRTIRPPQSHSFAAQMQHFLAAVRGEEPPFVSADDGIVALKVLLSAYESARTGRTVLIS